VTSCSIIDYVNHFETKLGVLTGKLYHFVCEHSATIHASI